MLRYLDGIIHLTSSPFFKSLGSSKDYGYIIPNRVISSLSFLLKHQHPIEDIWLQDLSESCSPLFRFESSDEDMRSSVKKWFKSMHLLNSQDHIQAKYNSALSQLVKCTFYCSKYQQIIGNILSKFDASMQKDYYHWMETINIFLFNLQNMFNANDNSDEYMEIIFNSSSLDDLYHKLRLCRSVLSSKRMHKLQQWKNIFNVSVLDRIETLIAEKKVEDKVLGNEYTSHSLMSTAISISKGLLLAESKFLKTIFSIYQLTRILDAKVFTICSLIPSNVPLQSEEFDLFVDKLSLILKYRDKISRFLILHF